MNILAGSVLLAWILTFCVYIVLDVFQECRFQTVEAEREELLDALWSDE